MTESLLAPNRRVLLFALAAPATLLLAAIVIWRQAGPSGWSWLGAGGALVAVLLIALLVQQAANPRISAGQGRVWFHLRSGQPLGVPLLAVEAFFLGQGPAPLTGGDDAIARTQNLVARLSQKFPEWARQDVHPALGRWCDHYVTIRGAWCEPLTPDVVRRLNRRLAELQQAAANAPSSEMKASVT